MEMKEIEGAYSIIKIGSSSKRITTPNNSKDNTIESVDVSDEEQQNV